eukprot:4148009-Amphidinium_carterae.1
MGLLDANLCKALSAAVLSLRTWRPQCWHRKSLLQRRSPTRRRNASTVGDLKTSTILTVQRA